MYAQDYDEMFPVHAYWEGDWNSAEGKSKYWEGRVLPYIKIWGFFVAPPMEAPPQPRRTGGTQAHA